jgi:hypothetical protein
MASRSLFWLTYRLPEGPLAVLIVKAGTLLEARMLATIDGLDEHKEFSEGHELHAEEAPPGTVGRMLPPEEAHRLLAWTEAEGLRKKLQDRPA